MHARSSSSAGDRPPQSIAEAGAALRAGAWSAEALARYYLEGIRRLNPQLNAFITVTGNEALAAAQERDAELKRGIDRGPLHGIPVVYKDNFDTAGVPTTIGSELFRWRVPDRDATAVARLKAAGAVMLGKTNMNEFAAGLTGTNQAFGDIHNPWNPARSPGGSSGGTGAAVAAGLCLGGLGSDTSGSIRIPASWQGIVGLRPTFGRVSCFGVFPRAPSLDCAGPMARSVADTALLLSAVAGPDPRDPHCLDRPRGDYAAACERSPAGLRLGVIDGYSFHDVDPDVGDAVERALRVFVRLGVAVRTVRLPLLQDLLTVPPLFGFLLAEFAEVFGELYRRANGAPDVFGPIVRADMEFAAGLRRRDYEELRAQRPHHIAEIRAVFEEVDALITPTMPNVAPELATGGEGYRRGRHFNLPFAYVGLPALSMPCGFDREGLPIGLQLVADFLQEETLLTLGAAFEGATDARRQRPLLAWS
ncbi:amidase [Pelomicrobium methylotrophicum]|nr:amidase [Pelomicrobium methylotrophicum]